MIPFPDPPLRGDTIVLRPFSERDVEPEWAAMNHPTSARWLNAPPDGTPAEAVGALEQERLAGRLLVLTIADPETDAHLGSIVLLKKEANVGELAYVVAPDARGRGVARRAVSLMSEWAISELELPRLQLRIDPDNTASTRVAEACGYTFEGVLRSAFEIRGRRIDTAVWSRLPGDRAGRT
jgi:RimJ/RimL family protein N-acetyltransferase